MAATAGSSEIRRIASRLERRRGLSEEGRKNLIALVLAFFALAAMVAFAMRPAAILPVGNAAVENSLKTELAAFSMTGDPSCARDEGDGFICAITRFRSADSGGARRGYDVEVGGAGCWTAVGGTREAKPLEGCISILDYFGY